MSFSFNVRVASASLVLAAVTTKLDDVITSQPIHEHDKAAALATVEALTALVGEPKEGEELSVSVNGSIWKTGETIGGVSVGVNISVQQKLVEST